MRHPFNLVFRHQTPIEALMEWHQTQPGLPPTGFIFHMSRCGSTLVAQMLAALPQNIVISEAPPLDAILRAKLRDVPEAQRIAWVRGLVSALGQPRGGDERGLFIKFDAWHVFDLPLIRRAFPDVPWIFMCRNPIEVMVSQLNRRAAYLVPGAVEFGFKGFNPATALQMSPEEYCARALGAICRFAREQLRDGSGRVVNYTELPDAVWNSLSDVFRIEFTETEIDRMRSVTRFDAKNPSLFFSPDSSIKTGAVSELLREMSSRWIEPAYAELTAVAQSVDGMAFKI
jgi:hypothetical protein